MAREIKGRDVWSPDQDLGNTYTTWSSARKGTLSFVGLEAPSEGGGGVFEYPARSFDTKKHLEAAARKIEQAFEAGEIYVPSSFDEPYGRYAAKARASYLRAMGAARDRSLEVRERRAESEAQLRRAKAASRRDTKKMSGKQLCAVGDKACRAELRRRGRDPRTGKKVRR